MSRRIPPNRPGYGMTPDAPAGYGCIGIPIIDIPCTNCDPNEYLRVPRTIEGVVSNIAWTDYQTDVVPSNIIPISYPHPCQDHYPTGFLDVEYPDVPPVSVRGISLKPSYEEPYTCNACWEYERDITGNKAYYLDNNGNIVYPKDKGGNFLYEPAPSKTVDADKVDDTYLEDCEDSELDKDDFAFVTFEHCPCEREFTKRVITHLRKEDDNLIYQYQEWTFDGNRLIRIDDVDVCEISSSSHTEDEGIIPVGSAYAGPFAVKQVSTTGITVWGNNPSEDRNWHDYVILGLSRTEFLEQSIGGITSSGYVYLRILYSAGLPGYLLTLQFASALPAQVDGTLYVPLAWVDYEEGSSSSVDAGITDIVQIQYGHIHFAGRFF